MVSLSLGHRGHRMLIESMQELSDLHNHKNFLICECRRIIIGVLGIFRNIFIASHSKGVKNNTLWKINR